MNVCLPLPRENHLQKQWDFVLSNFPPDALFVIGDDEDAPSTNVFSAQDATYIPSAEELPQAPLVVLAPEHGRYFVGEESLKDFPHPDHATYLFGADHIPLSSDHLGDREPDHLVFIPTASTDDMFSHVAYAVVAWDRSLKRG